MKIISDFLKLFISIRKKKGFLLSLLWEFLPIFLKYYLQECYF